MRRPLASLRSPRGFALVVVLSFVALAIVLVLSLLTQTTTERTIISSQKEHHRAGHVAESAIAIALAQLRSATENSFNGQTPKPWTSQPGAIRVHSMTGDLDSLYKLYSAPNMKINQVQQLADDLPPADWASRGHDFADLNAPISSEGGLYFPILDPRDASDELGAPVEGFSYQTEGAPIGTVGDKGTVQTRRLPMPVRWLYVLQDGSIGTLGLDRQFIGTNPKVTTSAQNPIVARIAFWMDDESCKINVNTASEGAFWDTPRADTQQERLLAAKQPTRLEYQRQPGHPAGVCLSSVLLPGQRFHPEGFSSQMSSMSLENARDLWKLGRLQIADQETGTSKGGTLIPDALIANATSEVPHPRQARYTDFDGLFFDDFKAPGSSKSDGKKPQKRKRQSFFDTNPTAIKRLRRSSGFLTAHSAAPEVTLYGTPRIAMWPVHADTPSPSGTGSGDEQVVRYTPYDRTAVLAATLGDDRYLIQRSDPGNGVNDLEAHAPGKDGRGQNLRLFEYLKHLTDRPVPGYQSGSHATFAAKYGTDPDTGDRDSILLSMMDYVRSTNFADGHLTADTQFSILCPGEPYFGFGQVAALQKKIEGPIAKQKNEDPIKGFGRMMTVSEVSLIVVCRAEVGSDGKTVGQVTSANRKELAKPGDRELEIGFLVEGFLPEQGWSDYRPYASITMVGGAPDARPNANDTWPQYFLNGKALTPINSTAYSSMQAEDIPPPGWRGWGGSTGVRGLTKGVIMFKPIAVAANEGVIPNLEFRGVRDDPMQLKLLVYDTPSASQDLTTGTPFLVQVIPLKLPDIQPNEARPIPLPQVPVGSGLAYPLANRVYNSAKNGTPMLHQQDVVQSLIPVHGDYRLIAGRRWAESRSANGTSPLFVAHPSWGAERQAHSLIDPTCTLFGSGASALSLASASTRSDPDPGFFYYQMQVPSSVQPDFPQAQGRPMKSWRNGQWYEDSPQDLSDALRLDGMSRGPAWPDFTGDFDNGIGNSPDGPYTNRPDDGNWAALPQNELPYFSVDKTTQKYQTVPPVSLAAFSAQRMLPSPVMFGSLPTGVRSQVPWQSLLFRPQAGHYGATNPPDHLLLDLFWSPVLEPEPVSHPFETAGKININHQLVPFSYINRATALHAAMKAETMMAIPDSAASSYKTGENTNDRFRHYLDATKTLDLWKKEVFDKGKVFLTPGEICEYPLVSEGSEASLAAQENFWAVHRLTGDNTKEKPYANLYSRLTTTSNTFRLHYIVETIKKARSSSPTYFNPESDEVTAREQGTCLLRRSLDFQSKNLPDYLTETAPKPLTQFYRWEVMDHRREP